MASPIVVSSQTSPSASQEQIGKLDFLVGEWKGKGWRYRLDGSRGDELSQNTKVKREKDGSTLSITDKKKYADLRIVPGNPFPGTILSYPIEMSGTASVYYDEGTKLYYWRLETAAGRKKPFPAMLVEARTLQVKWQFPGSLSVVTIKVTEDGEWHERLDLWMGDKDGWFKMQETVLKRVK